MLDAGCSKLNTHTWHAAIVRPVRSQFSHCFAIAIATNQRKSSVLIGFISLDSFALLLLSFGPSCCYCCLCCWPDRSVPFWAAKPALSKSPSLHVQPNKTKQNNQPRHSTTTTTTILTKLHQMTNFIVKEKL